MAVKRNGLGKGLDSLIPNKTVKTTEKRPDRIYKYVDSQTYRPETKMNSREKILMKMPFLSWQILSNSLAYFSHFWYKRKMIIMKSLQEKEDGERQSLPD